MILKKLIPFTFLLSLAAHTAEGDLTLPGERWVAKFNGYICRAFTPKVEAPKNHRDFQVTFEQVTSDRSLDNGLVKATFKEEGTLCRYNAIILADNDASTSQLVESKAYAVEGDSSCAAGKAMLDEQFASNDYLYYGHPHNLAFLVPNAGAEEICGAGATHVGINFVVTGRIGR